MITPTTTTNDLTIRDWWKQSKKQLKLFFHLMSDQAPPLWELENPAGFSTHLERCYVQLSATAYPTEAGRIRANMLNGVRYLSESLNKPDKDSYDSQMRYELARGAYIMMLSELRTLHIIDYVEVS